MADWRPCKQERMSAEFFTKIHHPITFVPAIGDSNGSTVLGLVFLVCDGARKSRKKSRTKICERVIGQGQASAVSREPKNQSSGVDPCHVARRCVVCDENGP